MLFNAKILYSYDGEESQDNLLITGENFQEASKQIEEYYGEDLVKMDLELIGPDNFFSIEGNPELVERIKKDVVW